MNGWAWAYTVAVTIVVVVGVRDVFAKHPPVQPDVTMQTVLGVLVAAAGFLALGIAGLPEGRRMRACGIAPSEAAVWRKFDEFVFEQEA